jgi:hypothetical protein
VARAMVYRVRRSLLRSDFERATADVESLLRLSRDIRAGGDDVCQLVGVANDAMCCDNMIREILAAPGLQPKHCDRLLAALARHEAEASDPFMQSQAVNYLKSRKILYDLEHRTGAFDKKYMAETLKVSGPVDSPLSCINLIVNLGGFGGPLAAKKWGNGRSPLPSDMKKLEDAIQAMTAKDYAREAEAVDRTYAAVLALHGQTLLQRARVCDATALVEPLQDTNVAVFLEPPALAVQIRAYMRGQTQLRGTQCLVALRRWQFEHREPPADLETLVKSAGMKTVPIDPYSDKPLLATELHGATVVYSVGPDGNDDKAQVLWDMVPGHKGDYVFQLAPAAR